MRCALIYNPTSGRKRQQREQRVQQVAAVLTGAGHRVDAIPTIAAGSATGQAKEVSAFADVIFACGGDGTIHEVMQGLVSETGNAKSTLGIIPLGSANALARHLRLSLDPVTAALQQIHGETHVVPVGKLIYADGVRYFLVMVGAGPDGTLAYNLAAKHKSRMGRLAYYLHAARLFAAHRFVPFKVEIGPGAPGVAASYKAVSVMSARVGDLGGIFSGLVSRDASIHDETMRLLILSQPAVISLPLWFLTGWICAHRLNPFLQVVNASAFSCRPLNEVAPHFQADGEWLGRLPFEAQLIHNALRILLPVDGK